MIGTVVSECSVTSHQLRLATALVGGRFDGDIPAVSQTRISDARTSGLVDFGVPLDRPIEALLFVADIGTGLMTGNAIADAQLRSAAFRFAGVEPGSDPDAAYDAWVLAGNLLSKGEGSMLRGVARGVYNPPLTVCLADAVLFPVLWRSWRMCRLSEFQYPSIRGAGDVVRWLGKMMTRQDVIASMRGDERMYFYNG